MNIPTLDEMNDLHKKYAPNKEALDSVRKHCHIVRDIALQIADNYYPTNKRLVEAGALLHDIGVYRLFKDGEIDEANYITHGIHGYELLQEEGFDEALCRFALLHTGVGITKKDVICNNLPLPRQDYIADTDEEKIVMYADKFHSKSKPPTFNSAEWYRHHLETKIGHNKVKLFDRLVDEFGVPDLKQLMSQYDQPLR